MLTLLLILLLPGAVAFVPLRQDGPKIDLTVSAGYGNYYRRGQWIPVRVNASNSGDDLNGEIRVRLGNTGSLEETTYRTPLDLPRGARKQVFLYVSLEDFVTNLEVDVTDRKGHTIKRETVSLRSASNNDLLYAVITESSYGAVDLTGSYPGMGYAFQTNWRIDDLPPNPDALAGLDVLMIHDADTGALTTEQATAIKLWVQSGGHLIVTGGDAWQRTTAGLLDLLPVALQGTLALDSVSSLVDYLRLPANTLDHAITAVNSTPKDSVRVLVSTPQAPLIVRGSYGAGVVDFITIDPNDEPLRSWRAEKDTLWYTLIASTGQQPPWERGFSNWTVAREATMTMSSTVLPTFFQLCGFLLFYIVLIGPINYLALRRLHRLEWAWLTIPVLILVFSVLAYKVGFNLRGNVPTVNRMAVVHVTADGDTAQVTTLIGVQSPRRSSYDIAVERGYTLRALPETGIGLNVPAIFNEGTRYTAENIPIDAGMVASFVASGSISAPHLDATATWHLHDIDPPQITGSITNTSRVALEDAVLLIKGEARELGTLQPGETKTFEIAIGPQEPGPLGVGSPQFQYTPYNYGTSLQYSNRMPGWCFSYTGIPLTIPDVMQGERFLCSSGTATDRQQEIRRRYRLLAALITDRDLSGGRGDGAYLFAWTNAPLMGVELVDQSQADEDTNLYIFDLPVTTQADNDVIEVPPGLTTWTTTAKDDPTTMLELNPESFQIANNSQAAFQYMPLPAFRLKTVESIIIKFQGQGPLQVELWNWKRQVWVPVQLDPSSDSTPISNPAQFLGPENAVNVRILLTNNTSYNRIDYIKIAYRGQFE
jgi:hypothetical protein